MAGLFRAANWRFQQGISKSILCWSLSPAKCPLFISATALADYYHRRLLAHADALNWFREKYGIGDEMIARLKIGYVENAPWTDSAGNRQGGVLDELGKGPNAFTHAELSGTSAFRPSGSSITPFFNWRIVFPYWSRGHVVFMIGRKTPWTPHTDWETPKYKKLAVRNGEKHAYVAACLRNDLLYNEDILAARCFPAVRNAFRERGCRHFGHPARRAELSAGPH